MSVENPVTIPYTVGPRLSGHQLSGYLYYPAMILQYDIVYFQLKSCSRKKK